MPYQIDRFNGTPLVTVDDGTIDQTTDLKLVGKNYAGYGEIQNENFVFLLENFANTVAPPKPVRGQIWFDSSTKKLKFYDNDSPSGRWRTTGGAEIGDNAPTGLTTGDFWWKTNTNQLYAWNGSSYVLIGPLAVSGAGQTNLEAVSVLGTDASTHPIVKAVVDGITTFIISSDANFNLDPIEKAKPEYAGYDRINQGITLKDSNSGSTTTAFRFWGTSSDSDRLGGFVAGDFVVKNAAEFTAIASFSDSGFTVGDNDDLKVFVDGGTTVTLQNQVSNRISFKILDGGITTKETMRIEGDVVVPGLTDTYSLGRIGLRWKEVRARDGFFDTITATTFSGSISGTAAQADTLLFNSGYRSATNNNTGNTIVARDASGNFAAGTIDAIAARARYADLAEKYVADADYEPGTVLVFGGEKEVTVTETEGDHRVAGVVSTNPAYLMNVEEDGVAVALRGKVPVKVKGKVSKGDILITSAVAGYAVSARSGKDVSSASIIAKAIESKDSDDLGTVMAVVI